MTAAEYYATLFGSKCSGDNRCHWCNSPCDRRWFHNDPLPRPFCKQKSLARNPSSYWICFGCFHWHKPRTTVTFLDGTQRDKQTACQYSWWLDDQGPLAVKRDNADLIYAKLLNPPLRFVLALLDGANEINHIQFFELNDNVEVKASTVLRFTLNGILHTYSVYELEEALKRGPEGKEPGVNALIRLFGMRPDDAPILSDESNAKKSKRGRPWEDDAKLAAKNIKRTIVKSGG